MNWRIILADENTSNTGDAVAGAGAANTPAGGGGSSGGGEADKAAKENAPIWAQVAKLVGPLAAVAGTIAFVFQMIRRSRIFSTFMDAFLEILSTFVDVMLIPLIPIFSWVIQQFVKLLPDWIAFWADPAASIKKWFSDLFSDALKLQLLPVITALTGFNMALGIGKSIWDWITGETRPIFYWITDEAKSIWNWITTESHSIWDWITHETINLWDYVTHEVINLWDLIKHDTQSIFQWIKEETWSIFHWITVETRSIFDWITTETRHIFNWIVEETWSIFHWIKTAAEDMRSIFDWFKAPLSDVHSLWDWMDTPVKSIWDFITGDLSKIIKSYDVGTPFVAADQIAMIHKGERIVPAAENTANNYNNARTQTMLVNNNFTVIGSSPALPWQISSSVTDQIKLNKLRIM